MNLTAFSRALPLVVLAAFIARPSLANPDGDSPSFPQGPPPQETSGEHRVIVHYKNLRGLGSVVSQSNKVHHEFAKQKAVAVTMNNAKITALEKNSNIGLIESDQPRSAFRGVASVRGGASDGLASFAENLLEHGDKSSTEHRRLAQLPPYGVAVVQGDQLDYIPGDDAPRICIIDTGYDINHEDLPKNVEGSVTGGDTAGTGAWGTPGHSHGTHCAGTIAALDNTVGVVGVIRSPDVKLHIYKIFNDSGTWTYSSDLVAAVDDCVANGAKVISMSLGGGSPSTAEETAFSDALTNDGVLSIAAAGNGGNNAQPSYPASYDSIVSVAALDANKVVASFSQKNSQVEIAAPGVGVRSTTIGSNYASYSGTSMACPHVAAVAALVWSNHAACSVGEIREALNNSAEDLGAAGRDNTYGHGLVQAKAASDWLGTDCGASAPPPPTTAAPPACSSLGNSCTSNSNCCSNKCKGKPGSMTCK